VAKWNARWGEERPLIQERVEALDDAGAFAEMEQVHDESTFGVSLVGKKRTRAREELEARGVITEKTAAETQTEMNVSAFLSGQAFEQYYLVRCDIDCMCFSRYYWNVSYIRNPSVVDEYEFEYA
jgi:hypothetical protein